MMVSAVIPTYEGRTELLRRLIESSSDLIKRLLLK